ncbi:MAG: DUF3795 domain-containing protein [Proteobacteria bacterium]|nr:DUF3795 domain-containing protein [Pseudomonadota bacterium]MBU1741355.1 DUF3795 domain-containing protein [Pseudomonadota bacterium]
MDYLQMTSPCGIDCFNCPLHAAVDNENLRQMIAERMGVTPDVAQCPGCRSAKGNMPFLGWTEPCPQYTCANDKGFDFCHECGDFPCHWLHPSAFRADTVPHNYKLYNLLLIQKMGVDDWAGSEAKGVRETYFTGDHPILQTAKKEMDNN